MSLSYPALSEKKSYEEELQCLCSQLEAKNEELTSAHREVVCFKETTEKALHNLSSFEKDRDKVSRYNSELLKRLNWVIVELSELSVRNKDLERKKRLFPKKSWSFLLPPRRMRRVEDC